MTLKLKKIKYTDLNSRQKEIYNFQKVSSVLADYGFSTMIMSDDWQHADFQALHMATKQNLFVQLKGRLSIDNKYAGKRIWVCFAKRIVGIFIPTTRCATSFCTRQLLAKLNRGRGENVIRFPASHRICNPCWINLN